MARITQVGPGRKTSGTIDGVTYVTTRNGNTYARVKGVLPAYVTKTPAALKRQSIFKMVQEYANFHLRTLKQTITRKGNGTVINRFTHLNYKAFAAALDALADRMVAGEVVTLSDIEAAIAAYAAEHPQAILIAARSGYGKVYLTGAWRLSSSPPAAATARFTSPVPGPTPSPFAPRVATAPSSSLWQRTVRRPLSPLPRVAAPRLSVVAALNLVAVQAQVADLVRVRARVPALRPRQWRLL